MLNFATLQVPIFSNFPLINISDNPQNIDYQQKHKIIILKKNTKKSVLTIYARTDFRYI